MVLPPPEGWYLLDWGPLRAKAKKDTERLWIQPGSASEVGDYWDVPGLRRALPVLTAAEFWNREHERLGLPKKDLWFKAVNTPDPGPWKTWLRTKAEITVEGCEEIRTRVRESKAQLLHVPLRPFDGVPSTASSDVQRKVPIKRSSRTTCTMCQRSSRPRQRWSPGSVPSPTSQLTCGVTTFSFARPVQRLMTASQHVSERL